MKVRGKEGKSQGPRQPQALTCSAGPAIPTPDSWAHPGGERADEGADRQQDERSPQPWSSAAAGRGRSSRE